MPFTKDTEPLPTGVIFPPYPFNPLHDTITLDGFLSLEAHLWVPEFSQLTPGMQEQIRETAKPTGSNSQYTKQDIMTFFFNYNLSYDVSLDPPLAGAVGVRRGAYTYPLDEALRAVKFFTRNVTCQKRKDEFPGTHALSLKNKNDPHEIRETLREGAICFPGGDVFSLEDRVYSLEERKRISELGGYVFCDKDNSAALDGVSSLAMDAMSLAICPFNEWIIYTKANAKAVQWLKKREDINSRLIGSILNENKKLKPLRRWLMLPAWTVDDFCFLIEGKPPSDQRFQPNRDTQMLLVRALAACDIQPIKPGSTQYNPGDLINLAKEINIYIPYYMRFYRKPDPGLLPEVFNTDHANHSPELAAALECWLDLYADSPDDKKYFAGPKRTKWLKDKCSFELPIKKGASKPSDELYGRIAQVVNPQHRKAGGATPTGGKNK